MRKKTPPARDHTKSLKTFYQYAFIVFLLICGALLIRGFFLWQQSKYDPGHHFTLVVEEKGLVKEIISFNPEIPAESILMIKDYHIPYDSLAKEYGITSDAYLAIDGIMPVTNDVTSLLTQVALHAATVQSNMTIFDSIRLLLLSKNVATNNKIVTNISLAKNDPGTNTIIARALTDTEISDESISIQIINATNVSGMGQRLGKVLTNMGANVVDVSTGRETQQKTTIAYYGNESYTLSRLQRLLQVTPSVLTTQQIANIVITIGKDNQNTTIF